MNKTQTKDYIRNNIINKYDEYTDLDDKDLEFMCNILLNHEDSDEKMGDGVRRMWLERTIYGNKCFWLERIDGSKEDFSFLKCFSKSNPKSVFLKACRKAVESIVITFRDKVFANKETIICPILKVPITKHESHVDHDLPYPFITTARMFCEEKELDLTAIKYIHKIGVEFYDKQLEKEWIDYHNQYANLRVISATANQLIKKETWPKQ